jgi:hypothetical protein
VIECAKEAQPPDDLLADLRELNNLRNWIVHGFVYKTTVLVEKNSEGQYDEVDVENEIDWLKHFPRNRFNSLDRIDERDARKALLISFRALTWLQRADHSALIIHSYTKPRHATVVTDTNFDFAAMLDSYIEEAKSAASGI